MAHRVTSHANGEKPAIHSITVNGFDDGLLSQIQEKVGSAVHAKQPFLPVYIDSWGGSVYHLLGAAAVLQKAPLEVHTIVQGRAMSAGAMLFCIGTRRFVSPYATLMFHDVFALALGFPEQIKASAREHARLRRLVCSMASRSLGWEPETLWNRIKERCGVDWYIPATTALRSGIATDVGVPNYSAESRLEYLCDVP